MNKACVHHDVSEEATQDVVKGCKEADRFESQEVLKVNLENEEQDKEMLYRGILNFNLKEPRRDGVPEEQKVKRLTFKTIFTKGLLENTRKLVNDIEKKSGADVDVSQETSTVVLRGASKSVDKAEEMLSELWASAQEISLSSDEQHALLTEKGCLMEKLRERVHVSVQLQGWKLVLIGKPEKMEEAKEELRGILRESGELAKCADSVEKKLTYKKPFTRALTSKGGKLLKDIQKYSGTDIYFSHSSGGGVETVVLLGASESVVKAEQMLEELLSSAEEISLSAEEREALMSGGKQCIMGKIQQKLQVPAQLQGQKMMLFGKPEETREAKVVAEGELKLVSKILSGR